MGSPRSLPAVRVRIWQVLLRAETGERHLTPTPSGIHAMVSSWLHRSPGGGDGEPHSEEHRYAVRWRQVSEFAVLVELRLFDDFLTPLLVDRVALGNRERLGMVTLRVEGIQEVASVNLAEIAGRPSKGWRLRFPEGVTFKRGDVFMPWPDPYLLLGSIQRRLALICGRDRDEQRLPREVMASVFPAQVELQSVRWTEGDPRRASLRDVRVAIGEVDWLCTGDAASSSLIDRLLQVGELTGIGARTAWGTGVLEIADRVPMRAIAAGNKRRPRRDPSRPSGNGGTGRTPSPRRVETGEWGFDDERPGGSLDRRFGSE